MAVNESAAAFIAAFGVLEPLALGFSTGTWCVMYCAPVALPFLFGREKASYGSNASLVGLFLVGRLVSYAAVGLILGVLGFLAITVFDPVVARHLSSVAFLATGTVLLAGALGSRFSPSCSGSRRSVVSAVTGDVPVALFSGLAAGLHICPPFWAAAARSVSFANPVSGAAYFLLFYAGTLPFFLPLLGVPFFSGQSAFARRVARTTQTLLGGYFLLFVGVIPLAFGR